VQIWSPLIALLCPILCIAVQGNDGGGHFSSLLELDAIRDSSQNVRRVNNLDVLQLQEGGDAASKENEIAVCHMPLLLAFSRGGLPHNGLGSVESVAVLALAAQHLNTGNGTIVPEVQGLNQRCNVRFSLEVQDTQLDEAHSVDHVIRITDRTPVKERLPCAFLGAGRSAVSQPTSIITGLRGYPQLSPISTSADLDAVSKYPLFGRTIPSDDGTAHALVAHLYHDLGVRHLGVLHLDDSYGNAYAAGIHLAADAIAPGQIRVRTVGIPVNLSPEQAAGAIADLKATQYKYFFGVFFSSHFDTVMTEAVRQGIAGTGVHNWIFSDSAGGALTRRQQPEEVGSPLALAIRGSGLISASGGKAGFETFDKLAEALVSTRNPVDKAYIESKMREYVYPNLTMGAEIPFLSDDSFGTSLGILAPFVYDAAIKIGLAACSAAADAKEEVAEYFNGKRHFEAMLNKDKSGFRGATGEVIFNNITGTRDPESAFFTILNIVEDEASPVQDGLVQFKSVESRIYRDGSWEKLTPYIFNDGSEAIPADLPMLTTDHNHLNNALRITGLIMFALVALLSIGFASWTVLKRTTYVIKVSQPFFLLIICFGTLILGSAIVPLSIDKGIASQAASDGACQAIPWCISIGFVVTFSALFTKTHRINKLFNSPGFKRLKVTAFDVAKPMIALVGINVLILSLWTALDPLKMEMNIIAEDPFSRPVETYSHCGSNQPLPYLLSLAIVNLGAVVISVYQAYNARKISTEFSESKYIFRALTLVVLVCFIGIPVLIIASENTDAFFFVLSGIIFTICCAVLLLIFVPKIINRNYKRKRTIVSESMGRNSTEFGRHSSYLNNRDSGAFSVQESSGEVEDDCAGPKILHSPNRREVLEKKVKALKEENKTLKKRIKTLELKDCNEAFAAEYNDSALRSSTPKVQIEEEKTAEELEAQTNEGKAN